MSAPGPWTASVEAKPFGTGGHWYVVMDSEENGLGEFYGEDHEANVANLRLAAAAPDMYVELERAAARFDKLANELFEHEPGNQFIARKWANDARAALAKAQPLSSEQSHEA